MAPSLRCAGGVTAAEREAAGFLKGETSGFAKGKLDGKLEARHETLLRLLVRAGIALTDAERALIEGCLDPATLDRWIDNVLGAKTAADVLS